MTAIKRFWLPGLLIVAMIVGPVQAENNLRLKEEVTVNYPPLTLKDVIVNEAGSQDSTLHLGELPAPGQARIISQAFIKMIARQKGQPKPKFQDNPVRVRVKRSERILEAETIRTKVKERLRDQLVLGEKGEVTVSEVPDSVRIVPGPFELELRTRNRYQKQRGNLWHRFDVMQKGSVTTSFRVQVNVSQFDKIPFAKRPLQRGTILESGMVEWKEKDIGNTRGGFVGNPSNLIGMKLTRTVRAGKGLKNSYLKRPILIDRGDNVTIRFKHGNMTITAEGEAKDRGAENDQIEVENKASEQTITARVVNENMVEVNRTPSN